MTRKAQVISRATPSNLAEELDRLERDFARGQERAPRFRYEPTAADGLATEMRHLADRLERSDDHPELAALYAARARELAVELELCASVGVDRFWQLARTRYRRRDPYDDAADDLAARWIEAASGEPPGTSEERQQVVSDDEGDPRSLVSRMRAEVGARRLPVRVVVSARLSALAATGRGIILVASGRRVSVADVERTVLHEVEGHAMPRLRADELPIALFRAGTAFGSDDQEGRAIALEERGGWLRGGRRLELARRHVAGRMVERQASFVETVRALLDAGTPLADALRISARVHRAGGLAREVVYLPGYLRVSAALDERPGDSAVLGAGRVAVPAAPILARWLNGEEAT